MKEAGHLEHPGGPTPPRRFAHVLCVYPYRRELNDAGFFPPLGLEFIATVVHPHARSLDLVDLRLERGRTRDFLRDDTDLVCFSVNWDLDREFVAEEIRSVPPGVMTVLGGRHVTEDPERWLRGFPNVDAVVRGDGEEAIDELCLGVPLSQIAGLSYRENDRMHHNPNRTLGAVPSDRRPDRSLRRRPYYARVRGLNTGVLVDCIAATRGCPYNCTFCSFNRNPWGEKRRWSARSPESVVDEIVEMDARFVVFTDDLFTHDMDHVGRICDLLIARRIRKKYVVNARLEAARRPDVLAKMARAGFVMLALGIESVKDETLRSMNKGFDLARIREYCSVLRQSSMHLHGYFIAGNIGESARDMRRIAPFAKELGLDTIAISTLRNSPWSGLEELLADRPDYHVAPDGKVYSDACSTRVLRQLRRWIYGRFYTPTQLLRIFRKLVANGGASFLPALLPHLPALAAGTAWRTWHRARRRARKRRNRERLASPDSHE